MESARAPESRRKPTIAHIMPWSGLGGTEIATMRMADITRNRCRNVAFCLPEAVEIRAAFEKIGIETATYFPPEPSLRHGFRFYRQSKVLAQQLKAIGADIAHFADNKAAYHNSLAAVLAGVGRISHIRVTFAHLTLRQKLPLLPLQLFIFVSKEARQSFPVHLTESKARVIYDSIEVHKEDMGEHARRIRQELGVPESAPLIGMVARVSPQKDYPTLGRAAVTVLQRHPDTHFLVVGDNSLVDVNREHYREIYQQLVDLGVANRFIFTGQRSDVRHIMAAMDVSVLSTHREGFPLSILESMAMHKPVIATSVGGIPEVVIPGVTGYLHDHEDSDGLASAIIRLIDDKEHTRQLGESAFEHVSEHYSRQRFLSEILHSYDDVLDRNRQ